MRTSLREPKKCRAIKKYLSTRLPSKFGLVVIRLPLFGLSEADPYFRAIRDEQDVDFFTLIRQYVRRAIDVGANIGITSLLLSRHLAQGQIFSTLTQKLSPSLQRHVVMAVAVSAD